MAPEQPFAEPWEARAFALAIGLSDKGAFAWSEFAALLAAEIKADAARGGGERYYALWLAALQRVVVGKGMVSDVVIEARDGALRAAPPAGHGIAEREA